MARDQTAQPPRNQEANQPARTANVQAIVAYFESGVKRAGDAGRLGVELEHIVVRQGLEPVSFSEDHGVNWILRQLAEKFPNTTHGFDGSLVGVARAGQAITLEPAGQLELSASPCEELGRIRVDFEEFERDMARIMAPANLRLLACGYHPQARANDLELIPKERYVAMDAHFESIGPWGRRMMRGSAATQVSIDYYSIPDCLRKLRIAFALTPIFALVCDNTPVFEGGPSPHALMRTEVWRKCDPARCGIVPGVLDSSFTLEDYATYLLDTPAIIALDEGGAPFATEHTFGEVYAQRVLGKADIEQMVSMFFTDVRLKTYIEIRPADSMPIPFVAAYAALIKGLFYDEDNLSTLEEAFADVTETAVEDAKDELMRHAYGARVYGRPVAEIVDELFCMAERALAFNEKNYLGALRQIASQRETLASLGRKRAQRR